MTIGEAIRLVRQECGYSQQYLADLIGCDRNTVVNWESGRSSPPASMLLGIRLATGYDPYVIAWLVEPDSGDNVMRHLALAERQQ